MPGTRSVITVVVALVLFAVVRCCSLFFRYFPLVFDGVRWFFAGFRCSVVSGGACGTRIESHYTLLQ